jgi:hypothetical protein
MDVHGCWWMLGLVALVPPRVGVGPWMLVDGGGCSWMLVDVRLSGPSPPRVGGGPWMLVDGGGCSWMLVDVRLGGPSAAKS